MQRRKNYFIKKGFQSDFILKFLILIILESLLIFSLFMFVSKGTLTTGSVDNILRVEQTQHYFFAPLSLITLVAVVGFGIAGMIVFLLFSHRLAGPLFHFEKVLNDVSQGDLTVRLDLRRTDQLAEFKKSLNSAIASLDEKVGRLKEGVDDLHNLVDKGDDPRLLSRISEGVARIADDAEKLKVTAKEFKG